MIIYKFSQKQKIARKKYLSWFWAAQKSM